MLIISQAFSPEKNTSCFCGNVEWPRLEGAWRQCDETMPWRKNVRRNFSASHSRWLRRDGGGPGGGGCIYLLLRLETTAGDYSHSIAFLETDASIYAMFIMNLQVGNVLEIYKSQDFVQKLLLTCQRHNLSQTFVKLSHIDPKGFRDLVI